MIRQPMIAQPMPKGWKNPLRAPLYQVVVDMKDERQPVIVSPGLIKEAADMVVLQTKEAIRLGKLPGWANPAAVLCHV